MHEGTARVTPADMSCDTQRILCAVDHSGPSLRAARFAWQLAAKCKAELTLLNVTHQPDATQREIADYLLREHIADAACVVVDEAAQTDLCLLRDQLGQGSSVPVDCQVQAGEATTQIVAWAKDHAIDLIVVGHRGHNRLAGLLIGSVARRVIEAAPCPVLVVR
jgi:universal stress protein A